ncbi:MAG: hypothetical protein CMJ42_01370 [Phyllobacteriaceae bacterium]|nr:hypothetical protein [Phyllobacteriaceae bacterium]MBA90518.1 hypothetical protein [Phyllobacteriaceae bacterium]
MADLLLAPFVVAMRLPVLYAEAAGGGLARNETHRAVDEKIAAGAEGLWAAQLSLWAGAFEFWPAVLSGRHPGDLMAESLERASRAALQPTSRTVRHNFDRLVRR